MPAGRAASTASLSSTETSITATARRAPSTPTRPSSRSPSTRTFFPPGSGNADENGEGAGKGYNINIPLPLGTGNGGYESAFERVVVPALERFRPDLILVASGFDASALDPLGRMMVSPAGFARLTGLVMDAADRLCSGRIALCHEGGYSPELVPFWALP